MSKHPPLEVEFVFTPRPDAEERHRAMLAQLAQGMAERQQALLDEARKAAPPRGRRSSKG